MPQKVFRYDVNSTARSQPAIKQRPDSKIVYEAGFDPRDADPTSLHLYQALASCFAVDPVTTHFHLEAVLPLDELNSIYQNSVEKAGLIFDFIYGPVEILINDRAMIRVFALESFDPDDYESGDFPPDDGWTRILRSNFAR